MPVEMVLPLTFATFYMCIVKKLSNPKQRICINILLKNVYPDIVSDKSCEVLSDSECSNYAKGRRPLSTPLQKELNELSEEDVIGRLKQLMIQDLAAMANALRTLVQRSTLSESEKEEILKYYQEETQYTFIARVFIKCIRGDNKYPLTTKQIELLQKYGDDYVSANDTESEPEELGSLEFRSDSTLKLGSIGKEDLEWIGKYVPAAMLDTKITYDASRVVIQHEMLSLPDDYVKMIYLLKPALEEANLQKFKINEFIEVMDIDTTQNKLKHGSLEYWEFEGGIEYIISMLKMIYFGDVSDFAVRLIGGFDLSQSEAVVLALRKVSNENVKILYALDHKEEAAVKLVFLAHRYYEKAKEQSLDTLHDNTQLYIMGREKS